MTDEAEHDPWLDLPFTEPELRALQAAYDFGTWQAKPPANVSGYRKQRRKRGYRAWPGPQRKATASSAGDGRGAIGRVSSTALPGDGTRMGLAEDATTPEIKGKQ